MKDWNGIAAQIVNNNSGAQALIRAIAAALEAAENGDALPAPGKPVPVEDRWLTDLGNKIAQIVQRLNHMEDMQRGFADIVTVQAVRLDEQERRMKKVEEIAFKVQAEWTEANVKKWAKENLP